MAEAPALRVPLGAMHETPATQAPRPGGDEQDVRRAASAAPRYPLTRYGRHEAFITILSASSVA
jgi:hypothetical protein